jgi:hypothetical protein
MQAEDRSADHGGQAGQRGYIIAGADRFKHHTASSYQI